MIEMKEYSTAEIKKTLSISKNMWEKHKEDILEYMKGYFDYDIYSRGSKVCYCLKKQYQDWVPYKRKDVEKQKAYYKTRTDQIIEIQPMNTGTNIARIIDKQNMNIYNHKVRTIGGYIRPILKENYYSNNNQRVWCEFLYDTLIYQPLSEEQLLDLKRFFKDSNFRDEVILDIMGDVDSGSIDNEEAGKELIELMKKPYEGTMTAFECKYGFRPIRVPLWKKINTESDAESLIQSMPDRINKMIEDGKIDLTDEKFSWIEE